MLWKHICRQLAGLVRFVSLRVKHWLSCQITWWPVENAESRKAVNGHCPHYQGQMTREVYKEQLAVEGRPADICLNGARAAKRTQGWGCNPIIPLAGQPWRRCQENVAGGKVIDDVDGLWFYWGFIEVVEERSPWPPWINDSLLPSVIGINPFVIITNSHKL